MYLRSLEAHMQLTSRIELVAYLNRRGVTRDSGLDSIATEAAEYYWRCYRFDGSTEHGVDSEVADQCRKAGAEFAQGWAR